MGIPFEGQAVPRPVGKAIPDLTELRPFNQSLHLTSKQACCSLLLFKMRNSGGLPLEQD